MLGVVLWIDQCKEKAVIWCEDHSNLAFFTAKKTAPAVESPLEVGDLIRFDLETVGPTRYVCNPQLVNERQYSGLPQALGDGVLSLRRRSARQMPEDRLGAA